MAAVLALLTLQGCGESTAQSAPPSAPAASLDGQQRAAAAETVAQDCPQICGIEARSGIHADCLAEGGERQECGSQARDWYRDCLERECTAEDIQRDDCTWACRMDGEADREECTEQTGDEEACRGQVRDGVEVCLAECD